MPLPRTLILLSLLFALFLRPTHAAPAGEDHFHLLVLHSYHAGLEWTDDIAAAIEQTFNSSGLPYQIHAEYLDTKRFQDSEYLDNYLETILPYKVGQLHFDLIITSDNDAFNFVRKYHSSLFAGKPVFFCGVNGFTSDLIQDMSLITGIAEIPSVSETVDLALQLHPDTRDIYLVDSVLTLTGRVNHDIYLKLGEKYPHLNIHYLTDIPMEELTATVRQVPPNAIIFLGGTTRDRTGHVNSFGETAQLLRTYAKVPLYGFWDFFLNNGIVGGKLINGSEQGRQVADLAVRYLLGTPFDKLPVVNDQGTRYMFDYRQLQRFGIDQTLLPPGSTLINLPDTSYSIGKIDFWVLMTVLGIFMSMSIFLALTIYSKNRAERKIMEQQSLLSSFCNALPDLAFVVDVNGRFVDILAAPEHLLAVPRDRILGKRISELFPPEITGIFTSKIDTTLQTGQLTIFEYPLPIGSAILHFEGRVFPIKDPYTNRSLVIWIARDISERKAVEQNLANRARLASLEAEIARALTEEIELPSALARGCAAMNQFANSVLARIWLADHTEKVYLMEAGAGTPAEGEENHRRIPFGQGIIGIIGETLEPALVNDLIENPATLDLPWIREHRITAFAGLPLVVAGELAGVVGLYFREKIDETTFSSLETITDALAIGIRRYQAEEKLHRALVRTTRARDQIDAIFRSMADGIVLVDTSQNVVMLNKSSEAFFGGSQEEFFRQPVANLIPEADFLTTLGRVLTSETPYSSLVFETTRHQVRERRFMEARITAYPGSSVTEGGAVIILRDVTREREVDRMKSEFISIAAHELRTPLATVQGYAELLMEEESVGSLSAEQREYLRYIFDKSEVLSRIIDDMLDLGRIESGRPLNISRASMPLLPLVDRAISHFTKEYPRYIFLKECTGEEITLLADRGKIEQVIDNLLTNAVKYSPPDTSITITCRAIGDEVLVEVQDEGIGMTPEQVAKVFDKFYRVDTANTAIGGLGLGMSICKSIIERHGGKIWVESTPGSGTRVSFSIPATQTA